MTLLEQKIVKEHCSRLQKDVTINLKTLARDCENVIAALKSLCGQYEIPLDKGAVESGDGFLKVEILFKMDMERLEHDHKIRAVTKFVQEKMGDAA